MLRRLGLALLGLLLTASLASAADTAGRSTPLDDPDLAAARSRIAGRDWAGAAEVMQKAVTRDPNNADYHNLLAYSIRHTANPNMDLVLKHYGEALRLDPKHCGAHEYIGEAYLMMGNLPKAKEHLAVLDKLCFFPCGEYRDLKKSIQQYESSRK